jgi:hypothetical protein
VNTGGREREHCPEWLTVLNLIRVGTNQSRIYGIFPIFLTLVVAGAFVWFIISLPHQFSPGVGYFTVINAAVQSGFVATFFFS